MKARVKTHGISLDGVFKRKGEIVCRRIAGETVLVPIRGKLADMQRIFTLNSVGEEIWNRLDGRRKLAEIGHELAGRFDVEEKRLTADIQEFIGELIREDLIGRAER